MTHLALCMATLALVGMLPTGAAAAQPTTPPPAQPVKRGALIPTEMQGKWEACTPLKGGELLEVVTISAGAPGSVVGSLRQPTRKCRSNIRLLRADRGGVLFGAHLVSGGPRCAKSTEFSVLQKKPGRLVFETHTPDGRLRARSLLQRAAVGRPATKYRSARRARPRRCATPPPSPSRLLATPRTRSLVALEMLAGVGAGAGAAIVGGLLLGFVDPYLGSVGAAAGLFLGVPAGVYLAGGGGRGGGSYSAALGGTVLGTVAYAGLVAAIGGSSVVSVLGAPLPLVGAVVGYELSVERPSRLGTRASGFRWMPAVGLGPDGRGLSLNVGGSF